MAPDPDQSRTGDRRKAPSRPDDPRGRRADDGAKAPGARHDERPETPGRPDDRPETRRPNLQPDTQPETPASGRPGKPEKAGKPGKRAAVGALPAERTDPPKPLVRLRYAPEGYKAEVLMVAKGEEEAGAKAAGWQEIEVPEHDADFQEFPKWRFHPNGDQILVRSQEQQDKLEGFEDRPAPPEEDEDRPAVRALAPGPPQGAPPTPVDRGP